MAKRKNNEKLQNVTMRECDGEKVKVENEERERKRRRCKASQMFLLRGYHNNDSDFTILMSAIISQISQYKLQHGTFNSSKCCRIFSLDYRHFSVLLKLKVIPSAGVLVESALMK